MSMPSPAPQSGAATSRIEETEVARTKLARALETHEDEIARAMASWLHAGARTYSVRASTSPSADEADACREEVRRLIQWLRDPGGLRGGPRDVSWPSLEIRRVAQLSCSAVEESLRACAFNDFSPEQHRIATVLLTRYFTPLEALDQE